MLLRPRPRPSSAMRPSRPVLPCVCVVRWVWGVGCVLSTAPIPPPASSSPCSITSTLDSPSSPSTLRLASPTVYPWVPTSSSTMSSPYLSRTSAQLPIVTPTAVRLSHPDVTTYSSVTQNSYSSGLDTLAYVLHLSFPRSACIPIPMYARRASRPSSPCFTCSSTRCRFATRH